MSEIYSIIDQNLDEDLRPNISRMGMSDNVPKAAQLSMIKSGRTSPIEWSSSPAKRKHEEQKIWQMEVPSEARIEEKRLKVFDENVNDEESSIETVEEEETRDDDDDAKIKDTTNESTLSEVTEDSILIPQNILPQTPASTGLRAVTGRFPLISARTSLRLRDNSIWQKSVPRTEPKRSTKSVFNTPVSRLVFENGLFSGGRKNGDVSVSTGHRTLTFYDSNTPSPLETSSELREISAIQGKSGGAQNKGRNKKVMESILPSSSEEEDEEEEDEDEYEEEEKVKPKPKRRALQPKKKMEESDFDGDSDEESDEREDTPSKKPQPTRRGGGGGRKPKNPDDQAFKPGDNEDEGDSEANSKDGDMLLKNPTRKVKGARKGKKQDDQAFKPGSGDEDEESSEDGPAGNTNREGAVEMGKAAKKPGKKVGRKKGDDEEAAFKPDGQESEDEEEYEASKPARGRKKAVTAGAEGGKANTQKTEQENSENSEALEENSSEEEDGQEKGASNSQGGKEKVSDAEGGAEEESTSGSASGEESQDGDDSDANDKAANSSGQEDNEESENDSKADEGGSQSEDEDDADSKEESAEEDASPQVEARTPRASAKSRSASHARQESGAADATESNANDTPGMRRTTRQGSITRSVGSSKLRRIPTSARDEMKHRPKQLTMEHQRNMLRAEASFRIQEEFLRDGNVIRDPNIKGIFPTLKRWLGNEALPPPAPSPPALPNVMVQDLTDDSDEESDEELEEVIIVEEAQPQLSSRKGKEVEEKQVEIVRPQETEVNEVSDHDSEGGHLRDEDGSKPDPEDKVFYLTEQEFSELADTVREEINKKEDVIEDLKSKLKEATDTARKGQLEVAAKRALGFDQLFYMYDFKPRARISDFTGKYDEETLTRLEVETFLHPPFSENLEKNPFRQEDMYHRREIINNLSFPGNAMLIDFKTNYYFRCCNCKTISEVRILFFQDELVWSSCICLDCFDHCCCSMCERYTAPKDTSSLPDTASMIENFEAGKDNYESWIYMKGIWDDYLKAKGRGGYTNSELEHEFEQQREKLGAGDGYNAVEYLKAVNLAREIGLRNTRTGKRKRTSGEYDVGVPPQSKRRMIQDRREEIDRLQMLERRLPINHNL